MASFSGSTSEHRLPLSENHLRSISATMALLDKALSEFEEWAQGKEVRSVLYEIRNPLSTAQREMIAAEVAEMKAMLQEIASTLNLEGTFRSVDKMILSSCAILWTYVVELEGPRLGRYGEVPEGLVEYLDPKLAALNERLRNISDIVGREGTR